MQPHDEDFHYGGTGGLSLRDTLIAYSFIGLALLVTIIIIIWGQYD